MATTKTPSSTATAKLKQIYLTAPGQRSGTVLLRFADPSPGQAVVNDLPAEALAGELPAADLTVLLLPLEMANRAEWQRRARAWMETGGTAAPARMVLEEDGWIMWRAGQAVLAVAEAEMDALLRVVVEFSYYETALRALENEIAADWHLVEKHLPVINEAGAADVSRTADLEQTTLQAMRRRMRFSRLEPHLYALPDGPARSARLAAKRLRSRANIECRLEAVDAQIEVYEDIYEMANQRRGEYVNFVREYRLEWMILVVLMAELLVFLVDFYLNHWKH